MPSARSGRAPRASTPAIAVSARADVVASGPATCTNIVSDPRSRAVRLSGVSTATTLPLLMMTTRWQVCETSGRMCVLRTMVWSATELANQLPRLDDLLRIEAGGRLVEHQHLGVVDERLR